MTASLLTVLEGMEDSALIEAAQGGDQLAVERLLRRHQSLLDAQGSRFFLPGGDRDEEARIGFMKAVRFYHGGRGSSFRGFAALHYPTTVERGQRGETGRAPPAHQGRAGEADERPRTSLQCRENVVDLALAREQLRELSTTVNGADIGALAARCRGPETP